MDYAGSIPSSLYNNGWDERYGHLEVREAKKEKGYDNKGVCGCTSK